MNPESLLPVLCEWLVKSALLASGAWLLLQAWRSATAAQRHLVWSLALAAIILLPITRLTAPRWAISLQPVKHTVVTLPVTSPSVVEPIDFAPVAYIAPAPVPVRTPLDWRKILLATWLGGVTLVLGFRLLGSWRLHRLYRRSTPVDDPRARLLLAGIASELGLRRRVEIRLSEECRVPVTWGSWRPVMLLPRRALTWSDTWLTAAIRHEAAHILRHDDLTRWIAWTACALYWPNPFIWLAARSLRIAQEQAADDLVLRSGTPAEEYATQLVDAARTVAEHGFFAGHAVAMACPSTLEGRILAIVDGHRDRRPLSSVATIVGAFTILVTLGICAAAQVRAAEQKDAAAAEAPQPAITPPEADAVQPSPADPAQATRDEASKIIIPSIQFRDATVREAVEFLRQKSRVWTETGKAIEINFSAPAGQKDKKLSISLTNVPLTDAVRYIADLADLPVKFAPGEITIGAPEKAASNPAPAGRPLSPEESPAGAKALSIILPKVEFREATIQEVLEYLRVKAAEIDPEHAGVNIVLKLPPAPPADSSRINPADARITLQLTNIPLYEALKYAAELCDLQLVTTRNAMVLQPAQAGAAKEVSVLRPLPSAAAPAAPGASVSPEPDTVLAVDKTGAVKWNGEAVSEGALEKKLQELKTSNPGASIIVRAAAEVSYKTVMDLIDKIQHAGLTNVALANPSQAAISITGVNSLLSVSPVSSGASGTIDGLTVNATTFIASGSPPVLGGDITFTNPATTRADGLITKEWKIEPDWIPVKPGGDGKERVPAKDWLISRGVVFGASASAVFIPATNRFLVRNTPEQIALVDQIIVAAATNGAGSTNGPNLQLNTGTASLTKAGAGTLNITGSGTITVPSDATKPPAPPINIQADSAQFDQRSGVGDYEGHVHMTWGQYIITADYVRFDTLKRIAVLTGNAEIVNAVNVIQADNVEIGLLENGHISIKGPHKTIIRTPQSANEKRVDDATLKGFGALLQAEQLQADGKSSEAQEKLREAKEALARLKVSDAALEKRLDQVQQRLTEIKGTSSNPASGNAVKPALQGRVLAVHARWNFAVLSFGERQGATANSTFNVVRGTETIARVRITSVEPTTSIADILPGTTRKDVTVQPGDVVLPEGVEISNPALSMRAPKLAAELAPPGASPLARKSEPGDIFVTAYMAAQKSEKLEAEGQIPEAIKAMEEAIGILKQVREKYPEWQPEITGFRMKRMEEGLERLRRDLPR